MSDPGSTSRAVLSASEGFVEIAPGVHLLPAQGNAMAVIGDDGVALLDSGPGGGRTAKMITHLRSATDLPVRYICYSHGHLGYNDGAGDWIEHNRERGEEPPTLVAHRNLRRRYDRYRETLGLQRTLATMQFPGLPISFALVDPDLTFEHRLSLPLAGRRIELIWVPSETDDCIAMWLPDDGLLYAGAAFPGTTIPNVGTPLRSQRFTIRWAESCELMASLGAETLVQEFGPVVRGTDAVNDRLLHTARILRWLRDEVVRRMNAGMSEGEILADITPPAEVETHDYLKARYGAVEYVIRDLYREENGWWDRNPTTLHPASPASAGDAVYQALDDPAAVVRRAAALHEAGDTQLAMHVVDLVANAGIVDDVVLEARALKAELCRRRADEVRPYVSKALYRSSAELLDRGAISWQSEPSEE